MLVISFIIAIIALIISILAYRRAGGAKELKKTVDSLASSMESLKDRAGGVLGSSIKWNFTKFLVAPDGKTVKRYAPKTKPTEIVEDIAPLLPASE